MIMMAPNFVKEIQRQDGCFYPAYPGHYYGFQDFDYFVVIDFEATCDRDRKPYPQEIIEFPSVIVNGFTGQIEDCFQIYVRPTYHHTLTEFCKDLTGIQQEQVDEGVVLSEALLMHDKWLQYKGIKHSNFAVVTWSNWDCKVMLDSECLFKGITKPSYFDTWINLRVPFNRAFSTGSRCNLKDAVQMAGLTWEGRAHCGLDDAMNTARLLIRLMQGGSKLCITDAIGWQSSGDMQQQQASSRFLPPLIHRNTAGFPTSRPSGGSRPSRGSDN